VSALDDLTRDYRVAFLQYLPRHEEVALARGYELGRSVIGQELSILDLAEVHHAVFLEVLRETPAGELAGVAAAASEFFLEVLAAFDMAQRTFTEGRGSAARMAGAPGRGAGSRLPDRGRRVQSEGSPPPASPAGG
jgi:hypothetical protein